MKHLILKPNATRTGFASSSDYARSMLVQWMKEYDAFEIRPVIPENTKKRRYLEGAVIPEYCKWQYAIDPRDPGLGEARRMLFKCDFHYEIVENRKGEPERVPASSQGQASAILDKWTQWAMENGCPVPNAELYKKWRDEWSHDPRFPSFHDFLYFLELEVDAMPSNETFEKLKPVTKPIMPAYPDIYQQPKF
jgi:hypothetical protein